MDVENGKSVDIEKKRRYNMCGWKKDEYDLLFVGFP